MRLPSFSNACIKVENHLYQVHEYFLARDSHKFCDLLAEPHPSTTNDAAHQAIFLRDVKSIDFERFLTVLYPVYVLLSAALFSTTNAQFTRDLGNLTPVHSLHVTNGLQSSTSHQSSGLSPFAGWPYAL
jgi:hypothetical protein